MLKQALDMSMQPDDGSAPASAAADPVPDFALMSEEDQIAYAMQLSMAPPDDSAPSDPAPMDTDEGAEKGKDDDDEEEQEVSSQPLKRRKLCQVLWLGEQLLVPLSHWARRQQAWHTTD